MKRIFTAPFLIAVVFVLANCTDEGTQPNIQINPQDTMTIRIKSLDTIVIKNVPMLIHRVVMKGWVDEQNYIDTTSNSFYKGNLFPVSDSSTKQFAWRELSPILKPYGQPSAHILSIVQDSTSKIEALEFKLSESTNLVKEDFFLKIKKPPYTITSDTLVIKLSGVHFSTLLEPLQYSSYFHFSDLSNHGKDPYYVDYELVQTQEFTDSTFIELRLLLEK